MTNTLNSVIDQIAAARAAKRTLRIRGGGSKDFYGNPLGDFAVLDTRPHSGITSYEPSELVVTVRAGTPLAELEAALLEKNQYLPFEPPQFLSVRAEPALVSGSTSTSSVRTDGGSTVGGMVASGLSGAARASSGSVRDHILGIQLVSGAGDVLNFGGTVMKNVAGYDVSRLMVGSMGTLALMTEVSLKVLPIPAGDATLGFDIAQADALALLNRWRALPLSINSSAWVDARGSALGKNALLVRLRGAAAAVESATAQMIAQHGGYLLPTESSPAVWRSANSHTLSFFTPPADDLCLWRLSLPAATPTLNLPHPQCVEWHGAQRWLWARASEGTALQAIASKVGGHAVLFRSSKMHGDADKAAGVFQPQSEVLTRINHNLRSQLDPHQIFNTRRM
ncbi:MAG: glycolate oxidase subunit GlcE [Cytophagales bacterium]|nr:glycolate oxidase subunit GlcE [Cytophagales bacterium]